jgi:hypothetical protein
MNSRNIVDIMETLIMLIIIVYGLYTFSHL